MDISQSPEEPGRCPRKRAYQKGRLLLRSNFHCDPVSFGEVAVYSGRRWKSIACAYLAPGISREYANLVISRPDPLPFGAGRPVTAHWRLPDDCTRIQAGCGTERSLEDPKTILDGLKTSYPGDPPPLLDQSSQTGSRSIPGLGIQCWRPGTGIYGVYRRMLITREPQPKAETRLIRPPRKSRPAFIPMAARYLSAGHLLGRFPRSTFSAAASPSRPPSTSSSANSIVYTLPFRRRAEVPFASAPE